MSTIHIILALLVEKKLMTKTEAEHIANELMFSVHPSRFSESQILISKLLADLKDKK